MSHEFRLRSESSESVDMVDMRLPRTPPPESRRADSADGGGGKEGETDSRRGTRSAGGRSSDSRRFWARPPECRKHPEWRRMGVAAAGVVGILPEELLRGVLPPPPIVEPTSPMAEFLRDASPTVSLRRISRFTNTPGRCGVDAANVCLRLFGNCCFWGPLEALPSPSQCSVMCPRESLLK
jgi:hypothetical protein